MQTIIVALKQPEPSSTKVHWSLACERICLNYLSNFSISWSAGNMFILPKLGLYWKQRTQKCDCFCWTWITRRKNKQTKMLLLMRAWSFMLWPNDPAAHGAQMHHKEVSRAAGVSEHCLNHYRRLVYKLGFVYFLPLFVQLCCSC